MLLCKKCKMEHIIEGNADFHHIVPKVIGGTDKDGRLALCGAKKGNDCHRKLHHFLREDIEIKELLKRKTQEWLNK